MSQASFRLIRVALMFAIASFFIPGCDCTDDTIGGEVCVSSAECPGDLECVEGVCQDLTNQDQPDAGDLDADEPDADEPDVDEPDADEPDADEPVDPPCTNYVTCVELGAECGTFPDGCGGALNCGTCGQGSTCGTGEDRGTCVELDCAAVTCDEVNVECGSIADGCGGTIPCGTCGAGEVCDRGECVAEDISCTPITSCPTQECGSIPDGCGGTLECGTCGGDQYCVGGQCEDFDCDPLSCTDHGAECGTMPDGCGGSTDSCGTCTGGQICGTGADRGQCVDPACVPLTCADYPNINCGFMPDGCGGLTANCGDCLDPEICGGGGIPNVCGADVQPDCDNLCDYQVLCPGPSATTLVGTVYAPNGTLPIPNATVYVPNVPLDQLPPITSGAVCEQCEDEDLGEPVVGTITDFDGSFELRNVPADTEFPLVIKVGKWRRVVMIDPVSPCSTVFLGSGDTRLPQVHQEGSVHDNIPRIAISTGTVDAMECVLHKLGVQSSQFTRRSESGRIHMYRSNGGMPDAGLASACSGRCDSWSCTDHNLSCGSGGTGTLLVDNLAHHLYGSLATLQSYDMVIMDCEGFDRTSLRTTQQLNRMRDYVNSGGRLFASHFAYDWLHNTPELQDTATWNGPATYYPGYGRGYVDTAAHGGTFWDWLIHVNAQFSVSPAEIEINDPRFYVSGVNSALATRLVYTQAGQPHHHGYNSIQQYIFDTPVYAPADQQCGRVAYSAFHVTGVSTGHGPAFPGYCPGGDLTAQEKVLAYVLFDLGACVSETGELPDPTCEPQTCSDVGASCGQISDGCGGTAQCGPCPTGTVCINNQCSGGCEPLTCADAGANCGTISDGCGSTVDCGVCPTGTTCGGGGTPNVCDCQPLTCSDHGAECGTVSDGCGGTLDCGVCPSGTSCGGGGVPNVCDCDSLRCEDHGAECGTVSNGCGGTLSCGDCPSPEVCGVGGPNQCGCEVLSCEDHGAECGQVTNGCGGTLSCGECPEGFVCEELECVEEACRVVGEACSQNGQCCSNLCTAGTSGSGVCVNN